MHVSGVAMFSFEENEARETLNVLEVIVWTSTGCCLLHPAGLSVRIFKVLRMLSRVHQRPILFISFIFSRLQRWQVLRARSKAGFMLQVLCKTLRSWNIFI